MTPERVSFQYDAHGSFHVYTEILILELGGVYMIRECVSFQYDAHSLFHVYIEVLILELSGVYMTPE